MRYRVTLKGKVYEVEVEKGEAILADEYDAKVPAPAAVPVAAPVQEAIPLIPAAEKPVAGNTVDAPIPGAVVSVKVKQGERVKKGQILVVIEAMKMENEILSPKDGTVKQVCVKIGVSVNTGDPMIVID